MIDKNSGMLYRFRLEHDLGFGFCEIYDFTDEVFFDGRIGYVFNRRDNIEEKSYNCQDIRKSGIALGPIRLYKFPGTRGLHAWKLIGKADNFLIDEQPTVKVLQGLEWTDNNWNNFKTWYRSDADLNNWPPYLPYEELRHLETRVLSGVLGVVRKFTMKVIIDEGKKLSDYYDLSELENKNVFVQLINTYYPLKKTLNLLKQLP